MSLNRRSIVATLALLAASAASAQTPAAPLPRNATLTVSTPHSFPILVQRLEDAIKANKMGLVNAASASDGAKAQGFTIPGNRVAGVFRNDFARRMLAASLTSGIEAPIRIYITENADGTGTLSYRTPSVVFGPYFADALPDLRKVAEELDPIFAKIVADAASK